jgi:chromosome partitioning protein
MITITLLQEKGGVGKTTIATHLAAGLAIQGQRVVLVDADAQANATLAMGIEEQPGLYDLLIREAAFNDVLQRVSPDVYADNVSKGELFLVPSNVEARNIANMLPDVTAVRERFEELNEWADVIIFDTPPTPSLFHSAIYIATDAVLYPCTCEALSLAGLEKSMSRLKASASYRINSGQKPAEALGIIPTMYRPTTLHSYNLQQVKEQHGDLVWREIPQRIAWSEATQLRQTVFAYAPSSEAAADAWEVVKHVQQSTKVR